YPIVDLRRVPRRCGGVFESEHSPSIVSTQRARFRPGGEAYSPPCRTQSRVASFKSISACLGLHRTSPRSTVTEARGNVKRADGPPGCTLFAIGPSGSA